MRKDIYLARFLGNQTESRKNRAIWKVFLETEQKSQKQSNSNFLFFPFTFSQKTQRKNRAIPTNAETKTIRTKTDQF